jgi:glycosyltransferase involved in cell wall biosynthesis
MSLDTEKKTPGKLRILHCPIVALYQPYLYVKGLREIGHEAHYMVHHFAPHSWLGRDCDIDLALDTSGGLQREKTREVEFFIHALEHYDVFHFHSGFGPLSPQYSLWNRFDELSYLKKRGKKIVMSWWGCDLRTEEVDGVHENSACRDCEPGIRKACGASREKREMIRKAFSLADLHLSCGDLVTSYKGVQWIDNAVDCNEWKPLEYGEIPEPFRLPRSDALRIYHSFGNASLRGDVKGTGEIKEAVDRLKSEGHHLEFIFFEKVPSRDLKYYQAQAHIVIDQLKAGWYGSTAVECLAMAKPVITYMRPDIEASSPHDHPLIKADVHTIYAVLKELVENRKAREESGKASRAYAEKYHHYTRIAAQLLSFYEGL